MPSNKSTPQELENEALKLLEDSPEEGKETPDEPELKDLLAKEKEDLDEEEIEIIKKNSDKLTDEQRKDFEIPKKEKKPTIEERYKGQQQENQVLYAKTKKFNEAVENAAKLAEPEEQELKSVYPNWEDMTDFERQLAKENLSNKMKFDTIYQATLEGKKIEEWNQKVEGFLVEGITKYPNLVGKEEAFKNFSNKETRRGVDLDVLVSAFLFENDNLPKPKRKNSLLESGSSGGGEKPAEEAITADQAERLRTKNQKQYNKLVRTGKINPEDMI